MDDALDDWLPLSGHARGSSGPVVQTAFGREHSRVSMQLDPAVDEDR